MPVDSWEVVLNLVLDEGTDALRLVARLHTQCEIYARGEGEHLGWGARDASCGSSRDGSRWRRCFCGATTSQL